HSAAFSRDSRHLALVSTEGVLQIYELGAEAKPRALGPEVQGVFPEFDPEGKRLATVSGDTVRVADLRTAKLVRNLVHPAQLNGAPAWRPDGRVLMAAGRDNRIYTWAVDREALLTTVSSMGTPSKLAIHPAGELAVAIPGSRTLRIWHVATGRPW